MFTELDARGIERVVGGALQCNGAQHAIVLGQRDRTDGVLAMLTRERLMGTHDMLLSLGRGNDDDRLLIGRLLHRQFDGADEVRPLAKNGAVGESGEPDVSPVQKANAHALAAEHACEFGCYRSGCLLEAVVVQACGKQFHYGADAIAKRYRAPAQQRLDPAAPPGDAVNNGPRILTTGSHQQASSAANPPCHADWVADGQ